MGDVDVDVVEQLRAELAGELAVMQATQDQMFTILTAIGILGLQVGFAMLETGTARARNTRAILMKNLVDFSLGVVVFYLVGWPLYAGSGAYIGGQSENFLSNDPSSFASIVLLFGFAITGATIMSGSVLGRMKFETYIPISLIFTAVTFPIAAHWAWEADGWIAELGFRDFAGSGVVHMMGGIYGLIGAYLCGPRVGRFYESFDDDGEKIVRSLPGHSATLQALGLFLLIVGWMYFNAGSSGGTNQAQIESSSRALINSVLSLGSAATVVMIVIYFKERVHRLAETGNAVLAGLVAVTGPCGFVDPIGALAIGVIAGLLYLFVSYVMLHRLKIDDPLDAFAVHGACGALGVLVVGLFDIETGLFYGGGLQQLKVQCIGLGAIMAWATVTGVLVCGVIHRIWGLALDEDDQLLGLDIRYHEGYAYPDFTSQDVIEYNRTKDAALRKMRPARSSESFEMSARSGGASERGSEGGGQLQKAGEAPSFSDLFKKKDPSDYENDEAV